MAKEKSIRQQVMEAGFGEMLERHGFVRRSATLYLKEVDGMTLKSALCPGYRFADYGKDRSFRDVTGYNFEGLDEMAAELKRRWRRNASVSLPIPGSSHRISGAVDIIACSSTAYNEEHVPQPLFKPPLLLRLFGMQPIRNWEDRFATDFPTSRGSEKQINNVETDNYWCLSPNDTVEDVTAQLCQLWERYVLPDLNNDIEAYRAGTLMSLYHKLPYSVQADDILIASCAGQEKEVQEHLIVREAYLYRPVDEIVDQLETDGILSRKALKRMGMTREEYIHDYREHLDYQKNLLGILKDILSDAKKLS